MSKTQLIQPQTETHTILCVQLNKKIHETINTYNSTTPLAQITQKIICATIVLIYLGTKHSDTHNINICMHKSVHTGKPHSELPANIILLTSGSMSYTRKHESS